MSFNNFKYDEKGITAEECSKLFGSGFRPEMFHQECYDTNNRFAYKYDKNGVDPMSETKYTNFVPTYDKWCLNCDKKDCKFKCSRCKFVYFCNTECQRAANPIHKKHCGRDLFRNCAACGCRVCNQYIECPDCPVKFCCQKHRDDLFAAHKEFDCSTFSVLKVKSS